MKIYQTEEEQVTAIKGWWKQNGTAAITGITIGIALIIGWNYWQNNLQTNAYQASSLYEQLLKSANQENTLEKDAKENTSEKDAKDTKENTSKKDAKDTKENISEKDVKDTKKSTAAETIAQQIITQHSSLAYATYAALLLAKTKVQQGDLKAAQIILEKQVQEVDSVVLKHISRLRLIRVLQAMGENEKGLQLIAEADQASMVGFSANYNELKGDLYVALDRLDEARTAYQTALNDGLQSPLLQLKLDDITATETDDST